MTATSPTSGMSATLVVRVELQRGDLQGIDAYARRHCSLLDDGSPDRPAAIRQMLLLALAHEAISDRAVSRQRDYARAAVPS